MKTTRWLIPLVVLVMIAAACGDDDAAPAATAAPTTSAAPASHGRTSSHGRTNDHGRTSSHGRTNDLGRTSSHGRTAAGRTSRRGHKPGDGGVRSLEGP